MQIIAAISTPIGMGAIGIVRVSGEGCLPLVLRRFSARALQGAAPTPNCMYLGKFVGDGFCEQCMMVYFAAPRSYTGEDMVELQVHGGTALCDWVLRTLLQDGARLATAGEFTKRAFLNGKLTLAQAEGVAGVIHAESKAELNMAYQLMQGSLQQRLAPTLQQLRMLMATLEASLDYPDEMQQEVDRDFTPAVRAILQSLRQLADTAQDGKMVRHGIAVAIVGAPNAGKSSLLNCILHEERAIVTPVAGTTRDTITESVTVDGVRLNMLDTAGLRDTDDVVEQLGVQRALAAADKADAVVYLLDATQNERPDSALLKRYAHKKVWVAYNKTDMAPCPAGQRAISAKTGEGVDALLCDIAQMGHTERPYGGMLSEDRHIAAVQNALRYMQQAADDFAAQIPLDCVLLSLRAAHVALGEIDGATAGDQVIEQVFRTFCVGK